MSKERVKTVIEWIQWGVTAVLLPVLVMAGTWARGMESRMNANELAVRLIQQESGQHNTSNADLSRELVALRTLHSEILQRLVRIETKLEGR